MDFRQGYVNLLVEPVSHLLNVEVLGEPERLGPGEQVEFNIRVTDQEGEPLVGEFSLAVVDQAVLALADPNSPEISEAFYGIQPLAVRLGFPLGVHAGRIIWVPGGLGGGGGDASYTVREQFEDTGYWQADIQTDENGEALVRFTLPDNLTTWQFLQLLFHSFPLFLKSTFIALGQGAGIEFTLAMISILFVHEMGHYIASRRRDIITSWPYFIPAPNIIGTLER